ncbi:NADP-dependent oxidoreductase domain-containing protein [Mycena rebaudengoi]|nr:NADP-dependent oxidoreductase domain-containing protein [Mycena rebaudengoi]
MAAIPYFTLNDGSKIPSVGMGCWMGTPGGGERVYEMVLNSLKISNEEQVGRALRDSGIPRSEVYVTTKLGGTGHHRVQEAFDESFAKLGLDYIDLYLMHWPMGKTLAPEEHPTIIDTWKDMEKLLKTGKVKSIGVSNFSIKTLEQLLPHCSILPVTNQVELHPCLPQADLLAYCEAKKILLTAYSPFAQNSPILMEHPAVTTLAEKLKVTTGQILINWAIQRGTIVIPKSENKERMTANITLVTIPEDDMATLDGLHRAPGMHKSLLPFLHQDDGVWGWTYEQLGWKMTEGGIVI